MLTSDPGSHLQLLLVGLLLCSSSVLLSGLDGAAVSERTFEGLCSGRLWTLCLGHTLSVTVLVGWSWTIYSVSHTRQKFQSRPLPSCCFSFPLILLDLLILTLWQILDPLRRVVLQHSEQSGPADQLLILQSSSEICSSQKHQLWISVVCVYKAPLLVFGCLLAWRIRTVDVDRRRLGGKLVALNVFVVTVFSVSGLVGALLTYRSPPVHFCVSAALVLLWNAFVLMTMFGPKVSHVWWSSSELKEEEEDEVEEEEEEEEEEDEEQLQLINQHLKSLTAQLDFQIETFSMQLREMFDSERFPMGRRYLLIKPVTHEAQVCPHHRTSERSSFSPGDINSPEQVRRRLSVQLPILHHSYLPVVGGLSSSSSSLFGSQEAFVYHYYQNHHQNHHHPVLSS